MNFTAIALNKIASLIRRDDFSYIASIESEAVFIQFENNTCKVTALGKVIWYNEIDAIMHQSD